MNDKPGSSFWRWTRRIALIAFILVVLAIGAGILYLQTLPIPSPERIAAADKRYRAVRELIAKSINSGTTGTLAAAPAANANKTSESLQARCDQLFTRLVQIKFDPYSGVAFPQITQADLDNVRALAALYDKGVRVSPAAQQNYKLSTQGRLIMFLAQALVLDLKPGQISHREVYAKSVNKISFMDPAERAQRFARYVESLKFLRVANCPTSVFGTGISLSEDEYLRNVLPKKTRNAPTPLLPEWANFNVELLAPREPLDWDRFLTLELDYRRDDCAATEKMTTMGGAFHFFRNQIEADTPESWYKPIVKNLGATTGAVIMPHRVFGPALDSDLQVEQQVLNYTEAYERRQLTPSAVSSAMILNFHNDQIMARLEAAAIELRQGKAIPSNGNIGPDSYYYDPVTQRPYMLRVVENSDGLVQLSIRRPIQLSTIIKNGKEIKVEGREVFSVILPANHPGLGNIPKM